MIRKSYLVLFLFLFACGLCFSNEEAQKKKRQQPYFQEMDFSTLIEKSRLGKNLLLTHFKLYQGYVRATNELIDALNNTPIEPYVYGALKRRFDWEFDGMRLHELYFENLGGQRPLEKETLFYKAIEKQFGSFEHWKMETPY
jgi:Fe-Mn family superoxide dismutase